MFLTFNLQVDASRFVDVMQRVNVTFVKVHTYIYIHGSWKKLEMFFIELDIDSLGFAFLRSAPHDSSKWARLDVSFRLISAYTFMAGVKTNEGGEGGSGERTKTYTTEVHSQPSLQSSFPSWQILPLFNTLCQGLKDLFERWSSIHRPRPHQGQWAVSQLQSSS